MKKFISMLLICVFSFLIIGCNQAIEKKEYTISFNSYTEEKFESIIINEKQTLSLPTPKRAGYTFEGWYPNEKFIESTKVTNSTIVGKTITLYAKWSPIDVTIDLTLNDGTIVGENKIVALADHEIILPTPIPNDSNYIFDGWYKDGVKVSNPFSTLSNCQLVAKYIDKSTLNEKYDVSFNLDGGEFYNLELSTSIKNSEFYRDNYFEYYSDQFNQVVANFFMEYNQTINSPYRVNRWYFFDYSYRETFAGNSSTNSNNDFFNNWRWLYQYLAYVGNNKEALTNLYLNNLQNIEDVNWSNSLIRAEVSAFMNAECFNEYSILSADYSDDNIRMGYVNLLNLKEYKVGEVTPLLIPIKEGYTFMGWYDNPQFTGLPIYELDTNAYGDKVLYAKWN